MNGFSMNIASTLRLPTPRASLGCVAMVATLIAGVAGAGPAPVPITLEQAVEMAQHNAVAIIQAEGQRQSGASDVRVAYASLLPNIDLSAGVARQLSNSGSRVRVENGQIVALPVSYNFGLGAGLTLFEGGQRLFDIRQAKARLAAADANVVQQRYASLLLVKQQYWGVIAARESEAAARDQLQQAELQRKSSIARTKARTATRSDSLRAEIQVRNARLAVIEANTEIATANVGLTRAIGAPQLVTATLSDSLPMPSLALDEATLDSLVERAPMVREAENVLHANHEAARASWTDYLPTVGASYARSGNGAGTDWFSGGDLDYSGTLRFSVSYPLFDRLQRESRVTDARVQEHNAAASLRDTRLSARQELTQYLGEFVSATERVSSGEATVDAAVEDLRVQQQRYAVGGSTLLDVLASQTQLDQARRDLIRARYDQRVAKAQLEALVGVEL
jgi:outer membrane protein